MTTRRKAGAVTIRQLARDTSAVIDRVRAADAPVIITRHGLPVAAIHPLEIDHWAPPPRAPVIPELEETVDPGDFELSELQEKVLIELADGFVVDEIINLFGCSVSEASVAAGSLELQGLVARGFYKTTLTKTGRRVSQALSSEAYSDRSGSDQVSSEG